MSPNHQALLALRERWEKAGRPMFLGVPDEWYEGGGTGRAKYRCETVHVSTTILKSEERGDVCLACGTSVRMTFPADVDGPLDIARGEP